MTTPVYRGTILCSTGGRPWRVRPEQDGVISLNAAANREEAIAATRTRISDKSPPRPRAAAGRQHRNVLESAPRGGEHRSPGEIGGVFGLNVEQFGAQQRGTTERHSRTCAVTAATLAQAGSPDHGETTSGGSPPRHAPAIGGDPRCGWQNEPAWKPVLRRAYATDPPVAGVRAAGCGGRRSPTTNDGLNVFLNALPTFAVGGAAHDVNDDEGWGLPVVPPYPDPELSWHLIESLVADEFDITTCQEMRIDHAFTLPLALLWPGAGMRPVRTVPIVINHVQHPLPTPSRCYKLGAAIGRAIESFDDDSRVVVIGSGGLSHQLRRRARRLSQPRVR